MAILQRLSVACQVSPGKAVAVRCSDSRGHHTGTAQVVSSHNELIQLINRWQNASTTSTDELHSPTGTPPG